MLTEPIGVIHFTASIIALITGSLVLFKVKGTKRHKQIGYVYCISMFAVLLTSFNMYRLHGTFGFFHWMAIISSISLLGGMLPMLLRRPKNYMGFHFSFMYWSVIGLYCAFAAEVLTRLPLIFDFKEDVMSVFYSLVLIATFIVGGIGSIFFRRYKNNWKQKYVSTNKEQCNTEIF